MSEFFKTTLIGDDRLKRTLSALLVISKRPRLLMRDMAAVLEEQTEENFAAQGRPKWAPLSAATIRARLGGKKAYTKGGKLRKSAVRAVGQMRILQVTGHLAASVYSQHGDDYLLVGAARPYARIQQLGGKAGKGLKAKLPSRPYLPFTSDGKLQPEAEAALLKTALGHLKRATE